MRFRPTARSSPTRATSTKSKRPARTTKSSSCRWRAAHRRKFQPARGTTRRRSIRRTENHIAWRSMARGGFEADKESLIIYERKLGQSRNATIRFRSLGRQPRLDTRIRRRSVFTAEDHGEAPIWVLLLDGKQPKQVARLHADDLVFSKDGNSLFFSHVSVGAPSEIARLDVKETPKTANLAPIAVTHMNDALARADRHAANGIVYVPRREQRRMSKGSSVRPPGFDATKKYPLKFLIHGGPQGAWGNSWTYRWNPELFAATAATSWS